jgi:hypothetical protein
MCHHAWLGVMFLFIAMSNKLSSDLSTGCFGDILCSLHSTESFGPEDVSQLPKGRETAIK